MREFIKAYWPFLAIGLVGLLIAARFVEPAPPRTISFAAGGPTGAYHGFAERYQRLLAEQGVTVNIVQTAGSVENLRLVRDGDADIGLVQGGIPHAETDAGLTALGGFFPEPVWIFVQKTLEAPDFGALKSARIAIGEEGSGTRALSLALQNGWGPGWTDTTRLPLSGDAAIDALISGQIDAAIFVAAIDAPSVQRLLRHPDITPLPFPRAPALARRFPALASTTLLRGVLDIAADLPDTDIPLIAPVAQMVVHKNTHPAIEAILLDAAHAIHVEGSLLAPAGTYPDPRLTDLPLSPEAQRYYRNGPTTLRRWFSFGTANFLERAWVLLIPLLTLMIPLARVAPPIYRWRVRRRIYVWYSLLRELEERGRAAPSDSDKVAIISELHELQEAAGQIEVPLSYTDDLYRLRNHIEFVETLLLRLDTSAPDEPGSAQPNPAARTSPA